MKRAALFAFAEKEDTEATEISEVTERR
jgi:hypothetical protein